MSKLNIMLPAKFHRLEDILCKTITTKSALQVDFMDPSCYRVSIQDQSSCPKGGVKIIGQSACNSEKTNIHCKTGNVFIPLMMRIETVRLSHQSILSLRIKDDKKQWISKIVFRALLTGCKLDLWDKRDHEINWLNHKAAIDFSRLFAWNLFPYTDKEIWKSASWLQIIEISSLVPLQLYNRPVIKRHQREANEMFRELYTAQAQNIRKNVFMSSALISKLILASS